MADMTIFPENSSILLVWVAVIETIAGVLKSRLQPRWVFWIGLSIQAACAIVLATSIVLQLLRGKYSRVEKMAAILVLIFVTTMSIIEAVAVYFAITSSANINRYRTMIAAAIICVVLMLTALPVLVGIRRGVSWRAFNSLAPAFILLVMTIFPALTVLLIAPMFALYVVELIVGLNDGEGYGGLAFLWGYVILFSIFGWLFLIPLSLTLGIVILVRGDNMSLSVLVLCNLFPSIVFVLSSLLFIYTE